MVGRINMLKKMMIYVCCMAFVVTQLFALKNPGGSLMASLPLFKQDDRLVTSSEFATEFEGFVQSGRSNLHDSFNRELAREGSNLRARVGILRNKSRALELYEAFMASLKAILMQGLHTPGELQRRVEIIDEVHEGLVPSSPDPFEHSVQLLIEVNKRLEE